MGPEISYVEHGSQTSAKKLKILITNQSLDRASGTEIVTRDLALALKKLGHEPLVYSPVLGPLAEEVRARNISVFSDVGKIEPAPDVIHGQHHPQILAALMRFPGTPALAVCHDATAWQDEPLVFPRVLRYVAVDDRCCKRWEGDPRLAGRNVHVILNAVDLSRFSSRSPLPEKPQRAAIFSNYATQWTHVPAVREACKSLGLKLDVIGRGFSTATSHPEQVLPQYDLVFAKARCALEAMAVGTAVVLCDCAGLGGMVRFDQFAKLRRLNFGAGTLSQPLESRLIAAEIGKYEARDAALVSQRTRQEASLTTAIAEWIDVYEEVIAVWRGQKPAPEERTAAEMATVAAYLETWGYASRIAWERQRVEELQRWPILGPFVKWAVLRRQAKRP